MKRKQLHTNSMLQCLINEIYILIESPFYTENFGANFSHVDLSMRELRRCNKMRVSLIIVGLHKNIV